MTSGRKRILFIHEVDYLEKPVYEYQEIPETLSGRGHDVFVLDLEKGTWRWPWIRWKTHTRPGVQRSQLKGSKPITLVRPGGIRIPILYRLWAIVQHFLFLRRFLRALEIDIIFLYAAPTNGLSAVYWAKRYKIPVLFRSIDILHEMRGPWVRPFVRLAERKLYPQVNRILALTPSLGVYTQKFGAKEENIVALPPIIDTNLFQPVPREAPLRRRLHISDQGRVVIYIGTFYPFSGLDFIAARFSDVLREIPEAHLLFVGGGFIEEEVKRICLSQGMARHVTFVDFQPFEALPPYLCQADLALNPFRICEATQDIVPSKIFQYLACGVPTLSTPLRGAREHLAGEEHGVYYADLAAFPRRMVELLKNSENLREAGARGRAVLLNRFQKSSQMDRLEEQFRQVMEESA